MFYLRSSLLRSLLPGSWVLRCWPCYAWLVELFATFILFKVQRESQLRMKRRVTLFTLVSQLKCAHVAIICNCYLNSILHDFTISRHHLCWDIYTVLFIQTTTVSLINFYRLRGGGVSKIDRTYFIERLLGKGDLPSLLVLTFCAVCSCSFCGIDKSLVCLQSPSD